MAVWLRLFSFHVHHYLVTIKLIGYWHYRLAIEISFCYFLDVYIAHLNLEDQPLLNAAMFGVTLVSSIVTARSSFTTISETWLFSAGSRLKWLTLIFVKWSDFQPITLFVSSANVDMFAKSVYSYAALILTITILPSCLWCTNCFSWHCCNIFCSTIEGVIVEVITMV